MDPCGRMMEKIIVYIHLSFSTVSNCIWLRIRIIPHKADFPNLIIPKISWFDSKPIQTLQMEQHGRLRTNRCTSAECEGWFYSCFTLLLPQLIDWLIKWKMIIKCFIFQLKVCFDSYITWFICCYEVKGKMWFKTDTENV